MQKVWIWKLMVLCVLFLASNGLSSSVQLKKGLKDAMLDLKLKREQAGFAVLTNAGYVAPRGLPTHWAVDVIQEVTGATLGKGNLLFFHKPMDCPLKVALMKREDGQMICLTFDGEVLARVKVNISPNGFLSDDKWTEIENALGTDAFSLVSILWGWALEAPWGLLKAAEFHNHLCPGLVAGYFLVDFIRKRYWSSGGESFAFIACPPWCKDDAIQILLDLTPGKKSFYVVELSEAQRRSLIDPNVAGILLISDKERRRGKAVILKFDWQKAYDLVGLRPGSKSIADRLRLMKGLLAHLSDPPEMVSVIKEVELSGDVLKELIEAGVNPYERLGLVSR